MSQIADTVPGTRREQQKEAKRLALIDAALAVFSRVGFAAAKIDDVAEEAGVSKGTVYLYFESKEALFEGMVKAKMVPMLDDVAEIVGKPDTSAIDRLRAQLERAAAITGGDLRITECRPDHLDAVLEVLRSCGSVIDVDGETVRCRGEIPPRGMHVVTHPYPGFPTDMQAQMMALASIGNTVSVVTDTIYHDRFTHVAELARLGADIRMDGNTAVIHPAGGLSGASVMATDLRASAALILAGLVAEGETLVTRVYHIDRGYEAIVRKLRAVGADVERVRVEGP